MDYFAAFQISASGMAVEKLRLDITAANIANMHTAAASTNAVYRPLTVVTQEIPFSYHQNTSFDQAFAQQLHAAAWRGNNVPSLAGAGVQVLSIEPQDVAPRMAYEPGHPYADSRGFVAYPGVNHSAEMVNINTALRAYEANVVAMNAAKTMAARTLDIGGGQ